MSEGIIKSGRKQSFTVLYKSAIEDKRLPLDARGLLAIMVGLPEGWQYSVKGLAAYVGVSKDTIRRLLEKLEKVGYLTREQTHDENGHFAGNVYVLQDEAPPLSGNTDNGEARQREKPSSGFPTQINTKRTKDRKNQTPIAPAEVKKLVEEYCGDDDELREAITEAADRADEESWPLPLPADLRSGLDSAVADIAHKGDRWGGALTAGLFLQEFAKDADGESIPWAHLDIAGPSFNEGGPWGHVPKGGTGVAVGTLLEHLANLV